MGAFAAQITGTVTNATTNKPSSGDEVVLLSLANGLLYFSIASTYGAIIDIAGPFAGVTYGFAVTMLQCGGVIAPTLTPILANRFGWTFAIYVLGVLAIIGSLLWLLIRAGDSLDLHNRPKGPKRTAGKRRGEQKRRQT